jgi:hypothetical protein
MPSESREVVCTSVHACLIQQPVCGSRSRRAPPLVFYMSCSVGCVWGFWWFLPLELHVYSSMWFEAEALSAFGVVPE